MLSSALTDVQLPDTGSRQHFTVFGRASPPLTSPKRGTSKASPCCRCQTHREHVRAHWWLPAPSTPGHSQAGLHPPGGRRAGARHGSGGHRCPWHSERSSAHLRASASSRKAPTSGIWRGVVPSCQAAAAGSPPPPGPGAAAGARVPLPEPGAAAAGAERLLRGSPGPWGAVAGAAVVCAKPGAWHPASPEESLVRWRVGTPGTHGPRSPMKEAASRPCPAGDMAGGSGGDPLCPEYPAGVEALCPERGTQMLPGHEAVGQSPNNWFRGGHPQENKAGCRTQRCQLGPGSQRCLGVGRGGAWAPWCPESHLQHIPGSLWACPAFLLPQGCSHPCPGCGYSHAPHPQGPTR